MPKTIVGQRIVAPLLLLRLLFQVLCQQTCILELWWSYRFYYNDLKSNNPKGKPGVSQGRKATGPGIVSMVIGRIAGSPGCRKEKESGPSVARQPSMTKSVQKTAILAFILASLAACGGSRGSDDPDNPGVPPSSDTTLHWDEDNWDEEDWG